MKDVSGTNSFRHRGLIPVPIREKKSGGKDLCSTITFADATGSPAGDQQEKYGHHQCAAGLLKDCNRNISLLLYD